MVWWGGLKIPVCCSEINSSLEISNNILWHFIEGKHFRFSILMYVYKSGTNMV